MLFIETFLGFFHTIRCCEQLDFFFFFFLVMLFNESLFIKTEMKLSQSTFMFGDVKDSAFISGFDWSHLSLKYIFKDIFRQLNQTQMLSWL